MTVENHTFKVLELYENGVKVRTFHEQFTLFRFRHKRNIFLITFIYIWDVYVRLQRLQSIYLRKVFQYFKSFNHVFVN